MMVYHHINPEFNKPTAVPTNVTKQNNVFNNRIFIIIIIFLILILICFIIFFLYSFINYISQE
jgi:magnesium-transporting ATPase (P-type)